MAYAQAYLEDYHTIKVILPIEIGYEKLVVKGNNTSTRLSVYKEDRTGTERHIYTYFKERVALNKDYDLYVDGVKLCRVYLGKITRSRRFDMDFYTTSWLGARYTKVQTTFRMWSPVTKEAYVLIEDKRYPMTYLEKGIWEASIEGDLEQAHYVYEIRINETFVKAIDPFAISYEPNFKAAIVIDMDKTYQMKTGYYKETLGITNAVIDEINIRDLTSLHGGGTLKDATLSLSTDFGLGYLKNIGFTHLQLMPVYGFGGVNEEIKDGNDPKFLYNWGYNPNLYNAVSNFLVKDSDNPYAGINELKEFIDTVHSLGMGVIMDVVYNHVYDAYENALSKLVPGYAFHTDNKDFLTNASGCGNDINSAKHMVRRFIKESLNYLQTTFHFDGFRFDLMGLLDVNTMNEVKELLEQNNPYNLIYGEGWNMICALPSDRQAKMENFFLIPGISFFNDSFRNFMKSDFNNSTLGFAMGGEYNKYDLFAAMMGHSYHEELFSDPKLSINFIECHDGMTFYDVMMKNRPTLNKKQVEDYLILSLAVIALASGVPFYHLGEEFGRTKKGIENSYNKNDDINGVDFNRAYRKEFASVVDAMKELLMLRKEYQVFRMSSYDELIKAVHFDFNQEIFTIRYYDYEANEEYFLLLSNDYKEHIRLLSSESILLFDGRKRTNEHVDKLIINKPGAYFIKK